MSDNGSFTKASAMSMIYDIRPFRLDADVGAFSREELERLCAEGARLTESEACVLALAS